MNPEFWHQRWRKGETGWDQAETNRFLVECWTSLNSSAGDVVFVPLCGKSRDMTWLAESGHHVLGVELDESAVQRFFAERPETTEVVEQGDFRRYQDSQISILVGDVFRLTAEQVANVNRVYDRAALIALPEPMRANYAKHMTQILPRPMQTLLITFEKSSREKEGPPFSVKEQEIQHLYGRRFKLEQLRSEPFDLRGIESIEYAFLLTELDP